MTDEEQSDARKAIVRALAGIPPTEGQYLQIGRFFHEFSQVEFSLRFMLARMAKIPDDYFDILTAPYDTNALCNVIKAVAKKGATPERAQPLIDVVKRFQSLNGERVRIAHGTWTDGDDGLTSRHVSRTSLEPVWHYGSTQDLPKLVEEAIKLQSDLLITGLEALSDIDATNAAKQAENIGAEAD
jgi:hypothetical protein